MKLTAQILAAAAVLPLGALIAYVHLIQLGWRRHGSGVSEWSFLHLDWIFQPDLPYWEAHLLNLAGLVFGLGLVVVGVILAWAVVKAAWGSRGE